MSLDYCFVSRTFLWYQSRPGATPPKPWRSILNQVLGTAFLFYCDEDIFPALPTLSCTNLPHDSLVPPMITTRLLERLQEKILLSCKQTNKCPRHKKKNSSAVSDLMNEKQITKIGEGNVNHTLSPFLVLGCLICAAWMAKH